MHPSITGHYMHCLWVFLPFLAALAGMLYHRLPLD